MTEHSTPHVLIVGGGVAALETLIALRDLADDRVTVTLVAPESAFYAQRVAFVVPSDTAWTLPLYELALMTARQARSMGVPADAGGFVPADAQGRVHGLTGVYAAGDGTTFPIKQGGLATQQADAVAETIAAEVGAPVQPEPFRPVLRGMLLTGGDERYMRHGVAGGAGEGEQADHALWWPPAKIAGRYLSAYLYGRDEGHFVDDLPASHIAVEIPLARRATASRS